MPHQRLGDIDINVEFGQCGFPLLMLHGFTGSIQAWQGIPDRIHGDFQPVVVDLIGHGQTSAPADPKRYGIDHAVSDLISLMDELGIRQTALLGYSMGGRVALHMALSHPERISALVLESAAPGIDDPGQRASRRASDEKLAQKIEQEGLESFVDFWESIPLFQSQQRLPDSVRQRQREIRLGQSPTGMANSLRGMGAGSMRPVTGHLRNLPMPILYLAGEFDDKYRGIGEMLAVEVPHGRYVEIPAAGHTIHLEQPDAYLDTITRWLNDRVWG
jgi:2-succinyl-6-hydroxy-2,4-cyclohexadiene-1-carboxylate synthase